MQTPKKELMLFFLKPDAVSRRYVGARLLTELAKLNPKVIAFQSLRIPRPFLADVHYRVHKERFFFSWLLDYVCCGDVAAAVLEGDDLIAAVRDLLGPTQPEKAALQSPNSLRARYGVFGGVNCAHASDSKETGVAEVANWRSLLNLKDDINAGKLLEGYISKYIDGPCVDSIRYRELSVAITQGSLSPEKAKSKFMTLLQSESTDVPKDVVQSLAGVMVSNCTLRG